MRRTSTAIIGLGLLMGALLLGGSPASAQECGGYFGPTCPPTEELTFEYPATVRTGQVIHITGQAYGLIPQADTRALDEDVDFVLADRAIGRADIADDGSFEGDFTVPSVAPGEYDITGTSGDAFATGPITVVTASGGAPTGTDLDCDDITGTTIITDGDPYDLDRDGDGVGCEENLGSAGTRNPLARTGFDATPAVTLGAAAIILGAAAIYGSRRRRIV